MNENEIRSLCKYWLKTFKAASLKSVALKKGVKFVQIDIADLERPLDNTKFNKLGFRYPNNEMNVILILKSYITKDNTNFKTACLCTNAQVAPKTHKLELSNYPNFWIPYDVLEVNHEIDPCFFVGFMTCIKRKRNLF